jgi:hypothetical protein
VTALFHALIHLARLRWLGAAFCALAMLCVTTHASALAGATAHAHIDVRARDTAATTASASELAQTKDRVWGFEQNSPLHICALRSASAETHPEISATQRETASASSYAAEGGIKALPAGPPAPKQLSAPQPNTTFVDPRGNALRGPPGAKLTGSPDGRYVQIRDADSVPTGTRIDQAHRPAGHPDPRAQQAHGHVDGVTNADGTPWLPIK